MHCSLRTGILQLISFYAEKIFHIYFLKTLLCAFGQWINDWRCGSDVPDSGEMAQAARLSLRMQKELKLLMTDPPPGVSLPQISANENVSPSSLSCFEARKFLLYFSSKAMVFPSSLQTFLNGFLS